MDTCQTGACCGCCESGACAMATPVGRGRTLRDSRRGNRRRAARGPNRAAAGERRARLLRRRAAGQEMESRVGRRHGHRSARQCLGDRPRRRRRDPRIDRVAVPSYPRLIDADLPQEVPATRRSSSRERPAPRRPPHWPNRSARKSPSRSVRHRSNRTQRWSFLRTFSIKAAWLSTKRIESQAETWRCARD